MTEKLVQFLQQSIWKFIKLFKTAALSPEIGKKFGFAGELLDNLVPIHITP